MNLYRYLVGLTLLLGLMPYTVSWAGPLHDAIEANDANRVRELIAQGESVENRNDDGRSPHYVAALKGHLPIVELLVGADADVNAVTVTPEGDRWTPLIVAAYVGRKTVVDYLVSHGANMDAKDNHGYTALSWAMNQGQNNAIRTLVTRGANVNVPAVSNKGPEVYPVVLLRAYGGNIDGDIPELLIKHGADVNAHDSKGNTPLHRAAGYFSDAKLLIEHGADVDAKNAICHTPLHWVAGHDDGDEKKIAMLLIEHGANVNATCHRHYTPLHIAVEKHLFEMVKLLVEHGASLQVESDVLVPSGAGVKLYHDKTPLDFAELLVDHPPPRQKREAQERNERIAEYLRSQLQVE